MEATQLCDALLVRVADSEPNIADAARCLARLVASQPARRRGGGARHGSSTRSMLPVPRSDPDADPEKARGPLRGCQSSDTGRGRAKSA